MIAVAMQRIANLPNIRFRSINVRPRSREQWLGAAVLQKQSTYRLWVQQPVRRAKEFSRQKRDYCRLAGDSLPLAIGCGLVFTAAAGSRVL